MSFFNAKTKLLTGAIFLALFFAGLFNTPGQVRAVWDGNLYKPGTTLNPECAPTQTSCNIVPPVSQSGNQSLSGTLTLTPATAAGLSLASFGTAAGNTSELRFFELTANGNNFVAFKSVDNLTGNVIWTLPNADGTTGQVLSTDGSGALAWTSSPTTTLTDTNIFVGNGSNVATGVALSGDATIANTGALTISNAAVTLAKLATDAVNSAKIVDGSIALADLSGNSVDTTKIIDATITNADISTTAAIVYSKLSLGNSIVLADLTADSVNSSKIVDGSIVATDLATDSVTGAKVLDGTLTNADIGAAAAIALSKLASGTSGQIIVANASGVPVYVGLSGDATINSTGALTIANGAVTSGKILDGTIVDGDVNASANIALSKLANGSNIVTSLAAPTGSNVNGGSITNNVLTLSLADGTNPGLVSTGAQTLAGAKTFSGNLLVNANTTLNGTLNVTSTTSATNPGLDSTGGTVLGTAIGGTDTVIQYNGSGTFQAPTGVTNVRVLVVAGGGGGGVGVGGGGGAGGVVASSSVPVSGSVTVTIGTGGAGRNNDGSGSNGLTSVFGLISATGGGGGAGWNMAASTGGSGGGGNSGNTNFTAAGTGTAGQGSNGGAGLGTLPNGVTGGGGGGAGAVGAAGGTAAANGIGGVGVSNDITGTATFYGGGGGGGLYTTGAVLGVRLGGNGGGGTGNSTTAAATAGTANTGGGGGGAQGFASAAGGSGVVIVRFATQTTTTTTNNLAVDGSGNTAVSGAMTVRNSAGLSLNPHGTATGNTSELRFTELAAGGTNYTGFKSPDALAGNVLYTLPTADGTAGQVLSTNASGALSWSSVVSPTLTSANILVGNVSNTATGVALSGDAAISNAGVLTISANAVALGTDTTGNYVAGNTAGTGITVTGTAGEAWSPTLAIDQTAGLAWTGAHTFTNASGVSLNPHGTATGNTSELRFTELAAGGTNYVGFKAPNAVGANAVWTLPSADGSANQFLKTDGSGTLVWGNGSVALSSLSAAAAINTIDNQSFAQQWNWSTLSNQTGLTLNDGSVTSGGLLAVTSGSTSLIGDLTRVEGTGSNAGITGNILKVGMTGASAAGTAVNITNAGTGLALRVNDDGTYTDTSPFVVDASGQVGIGVAAPGVTLDVAGVARLRGQNALRFADADSSNYVAFQAPATVGTDLTWTLPSADGSAGQSLSTNGSGGLSWVNSAVGKISTVHHSVGTALPITTTHNNAEIHAESTGGFTIDGAGFTEDTFGATIVNTGGVSVTLTPSNFVGSFLRDGTTDAGFATLSIEPDTAYKLTVTNNGGSKFLNVIKFAAGGGSSQWTTSGSNIYYNTGNVGIGTNTPSSKLTVQGVAGNATANLGLNSGNGVVTTVGSDTVITYTTTGTSTFTPPTGVTNVRVLVVAGGGGGGVGVGGGGGAGGVVASSSVPVSGSVTVTIGTGGAGRNNDGSGSNGLTSVFGLISATGGGGGAGWNMAASTGGSGGGGNSGNTNFTAAGTGTAGQGSNGGAGLGTLPNGVTGGGGGGAGAVGAAGGTAAANGIGGVGVSNDITGTTTFYGGGGGAGLYVAGATTTARLGGNGGGGTGNGTSTASVAGTANTGGGGGGNQGSSSAAGGSGIVIVRFATVAATAVPNQALLRVTNTGTDASSTIAFFETGANQGCIIAGQTGLSCSSDIRLKKNVETMNSALGNVLALKPVTYDWRSKNEVDIDPYAIEDGVTGNNIGFIAQDVEQIFPGLVVSDPNGKKTLAYDKFAPILVKSIQELASEQKFITSRLDQTEAAQSLPTVSPSQLEKLVISGALTVGSLEVLGESIFRNIATFTADANFEKAVVFAGDVTFKGRAMFEDQDMAGFAKIAPGQDRVEVIYEKEYAQTPVVQVSLSSVTLTDETYEINVAMGVCSKDEERQVCEEKATKNALFYNRGQAVANSTVKGFTILLESPALHDLPFSWTVIPVQYTKTHVNEVTPTRTPTPSPTPSPTPTPIPQASPSPTPPPTEEGVGYDTEPSPTH